MKPGDHPEFFTLPPPEGRSRESTIREDRDGRFWHEGQLVEHRGMAEEFASWVDRHPLDGRYVLNNGYDWTYFEVEDAPFVVRTLRASASRSDQAEVELNDGTWETLDPASMRLGSDGVAYCGVRGGRFEARFSRAAQLALEPYLDQDARGAPVLNIAGRTFPLVERVPPSKRAP